MAADRQSGQSGRSCCTLCQQTCRRQLGSVRRGAAAPYGALKPQSENPAAIAACEALMNLLLTVFHSLAVYGRPYAKWEQWQRPEGMRLEFGVCFENNTAKLQHRRWLHHSFPRAPAERLIRRLIYSHIISQGWEMTSGDFALFLYKDSRSASPCEKHKLFKLLGFLWSKQLLCKLLMLTRWGS